MKKNHADLRSVVALDGRSFFAAGSAVPYYLPIFNAIEKGYFTEEGLEVNYMVGKRRIRFFPTGSRSSWPKAKTSPWSLSIRRFNKGSAAKKMISMIRDGEADIPMKGNMQTGLFIKAVLDKETGIRGDGLLSEISVTEKTRHGGTPLADRLRHQYRARPRKRKRRSSKTR